MLKRFDRYVSRGADDDKNDDDLLEEIYMPEMTRNGLKVQEVPLDELEAPETPGERAIYTCSICPQRQMRSLKEVRIHIESKLHKKREQSAMALAENQGPPAVDVKSSTKQKLKDAKMRLLEANSAALQEATAGPAEPASRNNDVDDSKSKEEKKDKKEKKKKKKTSKDRKRSRETK